MDFEFKLLVKRNKFGLELLSKTELIENSGASLRRPLISVLCKVEIPSLIHLLQELCIIHFMNMCVLQNVEGNCRLLQFLLFSCIYVLIPFLNQTAFGLVSCGVIHRYLSIEFGCCSFFMLTWSMHPLTAEKMQCFKDPQSGAQPQSTRNIGSGTNTLVQGHSNSFPLFFFLCFIPMGIQQYNLEWSLQTTPLAYWVTAPAFKF